MATPSQIHDFSRKLRQRSSVDHLRRYVDWQRAARAAAPGEAPPPPSLPLLSINLDLATACNHACRFCVDAEVINSGKNLRRDEILETIDTLADAGLRSVILIGGGEPTLHPDFERAVERIKDRSLQLGIVTNGTRPERILAVAERFEPRDWLRFSLDAATDATYQAIHAPHGRGNSLADVLEPVAAIQEKAPALTVGYSFVVCWDGLEVEGVRLPDNVDEIPLAARQAIEHGFDYLALKPCLVKETSNPVETLRADEKPTTLATLRERLNARIAEAREIAGDRLAVHTSVNLVALLDDRLDALRRQPRTCHIGFFRQVVSPLGVYHCPAFRGDPQARVADRGGYASADAAEASRQRTAEALGAYDASHGCREIACFYNGVNHAVEELIRAPDSPTLDVVPDADCFL